MQEEKERRRAELTARAKEEAKRRFDLSALGDDADELLDGYGDTIFLGSSRKEEGME